MTGDGVAKMSGEDKTPEEKQAIEETLEAERRKQLEDQWNMGKLFLATGFALILWGWMNGVVSWHFHYLARLLGLARFPLPEDIGYALQYLKAKVGGSGAAEEL